MFTLFDEFDIARMKWNCMKWWGYVRRLGEGGLNFFGDMPQNQSFVFVYVYMYIGAETVENTLHKCFPPQFKWRQNRYFTFSRWIKGLTSSKAHELNFSFNL